MELDARGFKREICRRRRPHCGAVGHATGSATGAIDGIARKGAAA